MCSELQRRQQRSDAVQVGIASGLSLRGFCRLDKACRNGAKVAMDNRATTLGGKWTMPRGKSVRCREDYGLEGKTAACAGNRMGSRMQDADEEAMGNEGEGAEKRNDPAQRRATSGHYRLNSAGEASRNGAERLWAMREAMRRINRQDDAPRCRGSPCRPHHPWSNRWPEGLRSCRRCTSSR